MSISIWFLIIGGLVVFFAGLRFGHSRKEKLTLHFIDHFEKRLDEIQEKIILAQEDAKEAIMYRISEAEDEIFDRPERVRRASLTPLQREIEDSVY